MNLAEGLEKANRILLEEQNAPTLTYAYAPEIRQIYPPGSELVATISLASERGNHPRAVYENPKLFKFGSVNFDLLIKIFNQIIESDRLNFVSGLLVFVQRALPSKRANIPVGYYPTINHEVSALPLVAEFCVRTGHLKMLLEATKIPQFPTYSLAMMLLEIEEMMALNFNLFSDIELQSIPSALWQLREIAHRQTYASSQPRGRRGPVTENPHFRGGYSSQGLAITKFIDGIIQECSKARYFYLKGALQELPNLEIESDKIKVEGYLVKLGFKKEMVGALDAAEQDYRSTSTNFELKNCLGHLRTFLEYLHRDAAKAVSAATPGITVEDKWGSATTYLRQQGFFTLKHEEFIVRFYTLISDESIHALGAEREYARLLRNVVIEYGVMFLSVLDKRGVRLS
jgi:hypothetical protein